MTTGTRAAIGAGAGAARPAVTEPRRSLGGGPESAQIARPTVSAVVLTYNEERRLADCLASVSWADELVVVDGHSTDGTADVARRHAARVLLSDLLGPGRPGGFSDQRNFALDRAAGDWVFFVDADERVEPALRDEIDRRLRRNGGEAGGGGEAFAAYRVRRREHFFGVPTIYTHGEAWQTRLLRRGRARYDGRLVHEAPVVDGAVGDLDGHLLHHSKETVADYVTTMNRYTTLEAAEAVRQDLPLARQPVTAMARRFLHVYAYQRAYREGAFGLLMSLMFAFYAYLCWAKHWELAKNAGRVPGLSRPGPVARGLAGGIGAAWRGYTVAKHGLRRATRRSA